MTTDSSYRAVPAGLGTAENTGHFPAEHCRYFIVDGFGTQSAANAQRRRLDLKRILTPYPFDWSNTPINMMISTEHPAHWLPRERIGLLWAKDPRYIQRDHLPVLRRLAAMLPMHSFLTSVPGDFRGILINHVVVSRSDFTGFLQRARFIVGVGLPVDGPTALQAIAHGCVFINPARIPPTALPNKPNSRPYSSQHPYAEEHIKEPHVYTIDIADLDTLSRTVSTILDGDSSPFVHRWNSPQGYVDNLRGVFHNASCDSAHPPVAHPDNRVFASLDEQRLDDV